MNKPLTAVVLVLVGIGVVWFWRRGIGGVAQDVASGAVQAVGGVAVGAVKGVGATVGIPDTDAARCAAAKAAGNKLDASLYCPAGEFISWVFESTPNTLNDAANNF